MTSAADSPVADPERGSFTARYDWTANDDPSMSIVRAVAAVTGTEPTEMRPLYEVVDPEAMNRLVTDRGLERDRYDSRFASRTVPSPSTRTAASSWLRAMKLNRREHRADRHEHRVNLTELDLVPSRFRVTILEHHRQEFSLGGVNVFGERRRRDPGFGRDRFARAFAGPIVVPDASNAVSGTSRCRSVSLERSSLTEPRSTGESLIPPFPAERTPPQAPARETRR